MIVSPGLDWPAQSTLGKLDSREFVQLPWRKDAGLWVFESEDLGTIDIAVIMP